MSAKIFDNDRLLRIEDFLDGSESDSVFIGSLFHRNLGGVSDESVNTSDSSF